MDKFFKGLLKLIFQLLFFIALMLLMIFGAGKAKGEIPPPVEGENFQRPLFIDCQNYKIEKFKGVHGDREFTVCYYESYFVDGHGDLVKIIIPVTRNSDQEIILKGQEKR